LFFILDLIGALIRKGGEDEGQGWYLSVGALPRKIYPRVTFGRHHYSAYDFLFFHVFTELTTPNTMRLKLAGVVVIFTEVLALLGGRRLIQTSSSIFTVVIPTHNLTPILDRDFIIFLFTLWSLHVAWRYTHVG